MAELAEDLIGLHRVVGPCRRALARAAINESWETGTAIDGDVSRAETALRAELGFGIVTVAQATEAGVVEIWNNSSVVTAAFQAPTLH